MIPACRQKAGWHFDPRTRVLDCEWRRHLISLKPGIGVGRMLVLHFSCRLILMLFAIGQASRAWCSGHARRPALRQD